MGDPCTTPDCPHPVRVYSTEHPPMCDACRVAAWCGARAEDRASRCVHLGEPRDEWLDAYGDEAGRAQWLSGMVPTYQRVLSGPREGQLRTPAQARAAALRHWRWLRSESLRTLPYARRCVLGHQCRATAAVLDTDVTRDLRVRHHLSVVVCDRQDTCRDYAAGMREEGERG